MQHEGQFLPLLPPRKRAEGQLPLLPPSVGVPANNDEIAEVTIPDRCKNADDECADIDESIPNNSADGEINTRKDIPKKCRVLFWISSNLFVSNRSYQKMHSGDLIYKQLGVNQGHRDDCFVGNTIRFILHNFPLIFVDISHIHSFWKEKPYITNESEEMVLKTLRDFVKNYDQVREWS